MSAEESRSKPRRTPLVLWLALAIGALALLLVGVALFGPNPPIEVGKETTRITTPLAADGLPDYSAVLLANLRTGRDGQPITPERNGAIPFLRALWPDPDSDDAISDEDVALLAAELGVACPPPGPRLGSYYTDANRAGAGALLRDRLVDDSGAAVPLNERQLEAWLYYFGLDLGEALSTTPASDGEWRAVFEAEAKGVLDACNPVWRPWTADDLPFLAAWCDRNEAAIDLLVDAAERPEWLLPSDDYLGQMRGTAFGVERWFWREHSLASRVLSTRALGRVGMARVGLGQAAEAARDAAAMLRLAHHRRRGLSLVDHIRSATHEEIGHAAAQHVAAIPGVDRRALDTLAAAFDAIESRPALLKCLDQGERFYGLDLAACSTITGSVAWLEDYQFGPVASRMAIDFNPMMREHNKLLDDVLAAARIPSWLRREAALSDLETTVANLQAQTPSMRSIASAAVSSTARGELLATEWLQAVVYNGITVLRLDDRLTAERQLTRVAIAVASYRSERGELPATLDALAPDYLPKSPVDSYHAHPLGYRATDDGYLLYSLGPNGRDDGGSSERVLFGGAKLEGVDVESPDDPGDGSAWDEATGEYVGVKPPDDDSDDPYYKIPAGADDISLRMPPAVEPWPWEIEASEGER